MKKKLLLLLVAAIMTILCVSAFSSAAAVDLTSVKSVAVSELSEYEKSLTKDVVYSKSTLSDMDKTVVNSTALINSATTEDEVASVLASAKTSLDDAFTWEEEKADGKKRLESYVDLSLYSVSAQEQITAIWVEYEGKIDTASPDTSTSLVAYYVNAATQAIDKIQTIEEESGGNSFYEKHIRYTFLGRVINILQKNYVLLLKALGLTLLFSLVMVLIGTLLGVLLALMRMSGIKILDVIAQVYIEVIRGIPLLLQLTVIYIVFYKSLGAFWAVSFALFLNSGAYVAEIIRSGIQAVDPGQMEAARSLGLSFGQSMLHVVLPQAVKNILPALVNEFVTDIKETSLASTFTAGELMTFQKIITGYSYLTLEPAVIVAIVYFILTFAISRLIGKLERRLKASD